MCHTVSSGWSCLLAVNCLLAGFICGAEEESNWGRFRGPEGSGVSAEGKPPTVLDLQQNLKWATDIPDGISSPCIVGDMIFVTGMDGEQLELLKIDRESGQVGWTKSIAADKLEQVHEVSSRANSTPTSDGQRVYIYFPSAGMFCFDVHGQKIWEVKLPVPQTRFGSGTSPVIAGDLVLLNRDMSHGASLCAYHCKTGEVVWETKHNIGLFGISTPGGEGYSTPVVRDSEIIIHRPGEIAAYDRQNGKKKWWVSAMTSATSSPIFDDAQVYVATWNNFGEAALRAEIPTFEELASKHDKDGNAKLSRSEFPQDLALSVRPETSAAQGGEFLAIYVFDALDGARSDLQAGEKDGEIEATEWELVSLFSKTMQKDHGLLAIQPGGNGDATASRIVWSEKTSIPEVPSPVLYEGHVYLINNGGVMTCLDAQTGERRSRSRIGAGGSYYASPVAANGFLYVASAEGVITVLEAGAQFKVVSKVDLEEGIKATPAIMGDSIYVRTAKKLYAFGQ